MKYQSICIKHCPSILRSPAHAMILNFQPWKKHIMTTWGERSGFEKSPKSTLKVSLSKNSKNYLTKRDETQLKKKKKNHYSPSRRFISRDGHEPKYESERNTRWAGWWLGLCNPFFPKKKQSTEHLSTWHFVFLWQKGCPPTPSRCPHHLLAWSCRHHHHHLQGQHLSIPSRCVAGVGRLPPSWHKSKAKPQSVLAFWVVVVHGLWRTTNYHEPPFLG